MNNTFNLKRFGKCLGSDLVRGVSKYGITLLILSFLEVLVYLFLRVLMLFFLGHGDISLEIQDPLVNVNSFSAGTIFFIALTILVFGMPASLYGHVTDKHAGADYLMLPASSLEKFLSMVLVCQIIFPAVFIGIFLGTDALLGAIDSHYQSLWYSFVMHDHDISRWLMVLFLFSSLGTFLLGAIWFRRHKIIYTVLILLAISIALVIAVIAIAVDTDILDNFMDEDINSFKVNWIFFIWPTILLVLSYFRLRKIQH